jgi:hypothetical protein
MQYKTGLVSINRNGVTASFVGSSLVGNIQVGNTFKIKDENALYYVASVDSNTGIHLTAPYAGSTVTSSQFEITTDFTSNLGLSEVWAGDLDWPYHLTTGVIRKLDTTLGLIKWNSTLMTVSASTVSFLGSIQTGGHSFKVNAFVTGTSGLTLNTTKYVTLTINGQAVKLAVLN